MPATCKYCNKPIDWEITPNGVRRPLDPDGTPHHRTCRQWHKIKAAQARRDREARAAYGPAKPDFPENPNQLHLAI